MPLQPRRTVEELRELQELTGDENGAQRVAWTETWEQAREWLRGKVAGTGAEESVDAAGNQWFTLRGNSERAVLLGGRIVLMTARPGRIKRLIEVTLDRPRRLTRRADAELLETLDALLRDEVKQAMDAEA